MDTVIHGPFYLAKWTMSAFYFGDTRQQMTELASKAILKNFAEVSSSDIANASVGPSITIDNFSLFSACHFSYILRMGSNDLYL